MSSNLNFDTGVRCPLAAMYGGLVFMGYSEKLRFRELSDFALHTLPWARIRTREISTGGGVS